MNTSAPSPSSGPLLTVADASVLIPLAKMGRVSLLQTLYQTVLIGGTVYDEVVTGGHKAGAAEVVHVEQAIHDAWLERHGRTKDEDEMIAQFLKSTRLHEGEAEALAMAKSRNALLLVDDKEARTIATALGVHRLGNIGILYEAHLRRHLSMNEFEDAITDLTRVSWQSPDVIALVFKRAREAQP